MTTGKKIRKKGRRGNGEQATGKGRLSWSELQMRAIKVSVIKPWCPNASFKASSERQKGRRWWGKGKIRHRNRDRKLLEGGRKILADNLCVIYLCVMCIWAEYQCVKLRLVCLKVLQQGCPDWTQKHSFPSIAAPLLCCMSSSSLLQTSDLTFSLSNSKIKMFLKTAKPLHGSKSGLGVEKKHLSDLQIHFLPHFYLLKTFLSNLSHHISVFTH